MVKAKGKMKTGKLSSDLIFICYFIDCICFIYLPCYHPKNLDSSFCKQRHAASHWLPTLKSQKPSVPKISFGSNHWMNCAFQYYRSQTKSYDAWSCLSTNPFVHSVWNLNTQKNAFMFRVKCRHSGKCHLLNGIIVIFLLVLFCLLA